MRGRQEVVMDMIRLLVRVGPDLVIQKGLTITEPDEIIVLTRDGHFWKKLINYEH